MIFFFKNFDSNICSTILLLFVIVIVQCPDPNDQGNNIVTKLAEANNDFGLFIYSILATPHGNEIISPISLLSAFGVLYNGASGATLAELDEFMKMKENSMKESELREGFRYLSNSIMRKTSNKNDQLQLYMSNTVVAQTSLELKPEFQQTVKTYFKASVLIDNFGSPDVLAQTLNRIIKSQTNDKIDKMFDKNLDPHTQLMILNVVYFKGLWFNDFKEKDTKDAFFYNSRNEKEKVKIMSITGKQFNYINSPGILDSHILELPYIGKTFSLVVMLPRERQGLTRLRLNFNAKHVIKLLKKIALKNVDVYLPKFKLTETYSLKSLLQEKASLKVFNTGANYNRMTDQKNLVLNEVLHKVVIEVNEKGTEATAATNVGLVSRSQDQEGIVQFKADHPFLYFIWDRRTGMMLFLGQITHFNNKHNNKNEGQDDLVENMKRGRYGFKMQ